MADHPTPNRLLILWALQDEYLATLGPAVQSVWLSFRRESEVDLPADPEPPREAKPNADDVPMVQSTQAAYDVFRGVDELMGEADEFIGKAKASRPPDLAGAEGSPLRVEYLVTLRRKPADPGVPIAFGVGFAQSVDREGLLPRFLVLAHDAKAGTTVPLDRRPYPPGAIFYVTMLAYCDLIDDLRKAVDEMAGAADLPLPDSWFAGTKAHALLTGRVLAEPAVAASLPGSVR